MNVAVAYHNGDRVRAVEWLEHVKKLGALKNHTLYLLPAFDCPPIPEIIPFIALTDYLQVKSNWRTADGVKHACASGPNSMMSQFARHFYDNKLGPFFFCEVDCIVLKPESFDKLEEEYLACGKPFLGGFAPAPVPHINGNMIAPQNAALISSLVLPMRSDDGTRDIAFDVACAQQVLPQAYCTELIQHFWRGPSFTSQEDFDTRIRKDALFYHQCRDGSIYKYLGGGSDAHSKPEGSSIADSGSLNGEKVADQPTSPAQPSGFIKLPNPPRYELKDGALVRRPDPVDAVSGSKLPPPNPAYWTPEPITHNNTLEMQRARAAKARAALAAKRATGWKPQPKRRRRRRAKVKA